jgi:hypothetical protein
MDTMDAYEENYNNYMKSEKFLKSEDILKLMQYISKNKNYEFNIKFCAHLPIVNFEGYTVNVTKDKELIISVSTASLQATVLLALSKLRNMLLEETNDGHKQTMEV